ncbi:MAG: hypothetical protein DWI22_01875 [Planctomycetota bacterium]|nr:MAG: hypothetical protein DWI22_01875 [Planctomycetota bacterium]
MTVDDAKRDVLYKHCATTVRSLLAALTQLEREAVLLQPAALAEREWFELLRQKLIPQLGEQAFLVVAVVGGTNIGKSVIFNHLAGSRASATSPLASGTKHATCLVPEGFNAQHDLQSVFPDFELHEWSDASLALEESETHRLFWRVAKQLPPSLLVLDTPDIDSDARVNWVRADAVRRAADVLIAVLTQQKYNDAAVKEFFRKAGAEDKAVLVVFNQCLLPEDEPYWPIWLDTFCRETQIQPDAIYLTPNDRRAAEDLRLPFFERQIAKGDAKQTQPAPDNTSRDLAADLAKLRFPEIRMRTLLGSLHELTHPQRGIPAYLRELRMASEDLSRIATRLTTESVVQVRTWPSPGNSLLVSEIRQWWHAHQEGWARTINSAYSTVGSGLLWPIRAARRALQGEPLPPMEDYRRREWLAVLGVVEEIFDKLQWMADSGNDVIRPRIEAVLQGEARSRLLTLLRQKHDALDFEAELKSVIEQEMQNLRETKPDLFGMYRQLNNVSAAVRPMTSVILFSIGFGPAGEIVAPFLGHAAASAAIHVFADVAGGATAALAGEAAVSSAASSGTSMLQAWFHRLHSAFTARRASWLTQLIHSELLGTLPEDLNAATSLAKSAAFIEVQKCVLKIEGLL